MLTRVKTLVGCLLIMCVLVITTAFGIAFVRSPLQLDTDEHPNIELFLAAAQDRTQAQQALSEIERKWRPGYAGMMWDLARLLRPPSPRMFSFITLVQFLEKQTGQSFGQDLTKWNEWIWTQPYEPHPEYIYLKGIWYSQIDPRFESFFAKEAQSLIRLDEIEWGGVSVNGIPPLRYPKVLQADAATYLEDDHIVFGISINGRKRAYPKRILAWHEMALDRLGDLELTVVYCTLCGTVIPFESKSIQGHHSFGTSGLLYRSNKLMFDQETMSLWNTFQGIPVVGPLVGNNIQLNAHSVVTTTWKEWRTQHPETTVLSLNTGHRRDYGEGVAYRSYFGTDNLMFQVSRTDERLRNKDEVLVMHFNKANSTNSTQLAIANQFLMDKRVFNYQIAEKNIVVLTSEEGANRVYTSETYHFNNFLNEQYIADTLGNTWEITEEALLLSTNPRIRLKRYPAQRAFWFGWYAQFPETLLIH